MISKAVPIHHGYVAAKAAGHQFYYCKSILQINVPPLLLPLTHAVPRDDVRVYDVW